MVYARILAPTTALLLLASADGVLAQEPLLTRIAHSTWLRCGIVAGRVTIDGSRLGNMRSTTKGGARDETLNIRNENGQFTLSYLRTTGQEQLSVEVGGAGDRISIRRTPRGGASFPAVEFTQVPGEKIALSIGSGGAQETFRAGGIWQLLMAEPKQCREHLLPLLEMLRPNWRLAETVESVEQKLLSEADNAGVSSRARWSVLVAQLGSDSFARREAADRALRNGDAGALAYLRQLDFSRLDAEQQFRVRRIIDVLAAQNNDDSVEQIAASLAGDPTVWLALLTRPQPAVRQAAARQLTALLGEPIAVDPAADPSTQKDQREQIRARIEAK
jgi:hypothetical protein